MELTRLYIKQHTVDSKPLCIVLTNKNCLKSSHVVSKPPTIVEDYIRTQKYFLKVRCVISKQHRGLYVELKWNAVE